MGRVWQGEGLVVRRGGVRYLVVAVVLQGVRGGERRGQIPHDQG